MTDIQDPRKVEFDPETLNLFEEISDLIAQVNESRPFSGEVSYQLKKEFLPDRITASLNMEGISVSRRQTLLMMDAMTLTENNSKAELEIYNALKADELVFEQAMSDHPLTAHLVREINKQIQEGISPHPGRFREENVEITGVAFQPPDHYEVPTLIDEMISSYELGRGLPAVFKAVWLHATFTHIHPFEDGNGRTGRLLQDFVLLSNGLFPTGIPSSSRDDYYDALEKADDGDWNPLCQMVCHFELRVLTRVKALIEKVESNNEFIKNLAHRATEKKTGGLHKQYIVWNQRMSNIGESLKQTCDELNRSTDAIGVRTDIFDVIDFQKWKEVSDTGHAHNTWYAKQTWFSEGSAFFRTILFFSRHFFRPEDLLSEDELRGSVALKLTGGTPEYGAKYDFFDFVDKEVRFRELVFVGDAAHIYWGTGEMVSRGNRFVEKWECEEVDDPNSIVQAIVSDIFTRKLGI